MAIAIPIFFPIAPIVSAPHLLMKALRAASAAGRAGKSVKALALPKLTAGEPDLAALFQTLIANLQPAIEPPAPKQPGGAIVNTRPPAARPPVAAMGELPMSRPRVAARVLAPPANDPQPPLADSAARLANEVDAIAPAVPAAPEPLLATLAPTLETSVPAAPAPAGHALLPEPPLARLALPPRISLAAFAVELRPKASAAAVDPAPHPPLELAPAKVTQVISQSKDVPPRPEPAPVNLTRTIHGLAPAPRPGLELPRANAFHPTAAHGDVPLVDQPPPSAPEGAALRPPESAPAMKLPPTVTVTPPPKAEAARGRASPPDPAPPPRDAAPSPSAPERREAVPEPAETPHAAARSFLEVSSHPIEPRRAEAPKPEPPSRAIAAVGESRPRESHPEAVARPAEAESRPAAAASEASAPDAMVERAALHMSASGNTIELLLRAEHLGRVAVRLIERAGVIEVAVRSDSQPLRTLLAESLTSLVQTLDERGWQVARSAAGGETGLNWWTGADQQKRDRYQGEAKQRRALPGRGDPKFDVLNEVLNHD